LAALTVNGRKTKVLATMLLNQAYSAFFYFGENLFCLFMALSSQIFKPPQNPRGFSDALYGMTSTRATCKADLAAYLASCSVEILPRVMRQMPPRRYSSGSTATEIPSITGKTALEEAVPHRD